MTRAFEAEAAVDGQREQSMASAQEQEQMIKIEVPTTTQKRQLRATTGPKDSQADDCEPRSSVSSRGIASDDARLVEGITVGHGVEVRCSEGEVEGNQAQCRRKERGLVATAKKPLRRSAHITSTANQCPRDRPDRQRLCL
jgi:hypothetical protein